MKNRVFVYGTLLVPSVMEAVTGKSFEFKRATLKGFARYKIKNQVFPGIIESKNDKVEGIVFNTIDEKSLQRLDKFESDIYYRKEVTVTLEDSHQIRALAYIIAPNHSDMLTDQDWDLEQFKQNHLYAYIRRIL